MGGNIKIYSQELNASSSLRASWPSLITSQLHSEMEQKLLPQNLQEHIHCVHSNHNWLPPKWRIETSCRTSQLKDRATKQVWYGKRDSPHRLRKGRDLIHKCSLRGDPKIWFIKKNWSVWKINLGWGSGLIVAPKPKCGITQPSSRIAFYNVLTSSSSLASTTTSLVALVGQ